MDLLQRLGSGSADLGRTHLRSATCSWSEPSADFVLFIYHPPVIGIRRSGVSMGFGWETFLLELTIASVMLTATSPYNLVGWILLNFTFVRFMLQAGASKLVTGDKTWRDLTATAYHYLTQPIPNAQAWYAHKFPMIVQKISTVIMFWVELGVPLLVFSPPEVRLFCFINFFSLLFFVWQTGNFSYLNHMTIIFTVIFIHNRYLEPFIGAPNVPAETSSFIWYAFISLFAAFLLFLQMINLWNYFFKNKWMQEILVWVQPFHISHPHQLFSMMTTKRYEIIIEGSYDGITWKEYLFYHKASEISKRPTRISPIQPRLDWQAWFLPFSSFQHQYWFHSFISKLLLGTPVVTKLLRYNPFAEKPPVFIRVLMYDYEFTTFKERKETGNWWKRKLLGEYAPAMHLNKPQ